MLTSSQPCSPRSFAFAAASALPGRALPFSYIVTEVPWRRRLKPLYSQVCRFCPTPDQPAIASNDTASRINNDAFFTLALYERSDLLLGCLDHGRRTSRAFFSRICKALNTC